MSTRFSQPGSQRASFLAGGELRTRFFKTVLADSAKLFTAAQDAARGYEAGDGSAGDLAHAINCYRELYELLTTEELDPQQRAPGTGRSA